MEFPSDVVLVSDNSEPETVSQEREIGLDNDNIADPESTKNCEPLPKNYTEIGPQLLDLDPETDVDTYTLTLPSDNCELVKASVSTVETNNRDESDSAVLSGSPKVAPAIDQEVLQVLSSLNDPEDIGLNSPVAENFVPVEDTILENLVPVSSAEVSVALASDPMLLVNSDELNSEEMPLTDDQVDVESDHVVTVDVDELSMPLHGTDASEKSCLPACDTELCKAQNPPAVCGELEDLCSQESLALDCKTNAECELISLNLSDGVVVGVSKNCSLSSSPGNENTSAAADSSLSLLLPPPPDSPPILNDILPTSSLLLPMPSYCNEGSISPLAPAEWCQHCGVLAPTDLASPDKCLLNENCVRGPLEHLPGCQHYKESELEAAVDDVPCTELRSDKNVPNSTVEDPCVLGEIRGDAELDPTSVKNCDIITDNSAEGVVSNGQNCGNINEDADDKSDIEGADIQEVNNSEPEVLFAIDDLEATAEVAASSPVEEVACAAQTLEDLTHDSPVTVDNQLSDQEIELSNQEVLGTENDSLTKGLIDNREINATSLSHLAEESEPLMYSTDVSCDESERNDSTAECDGQTGTEALNESMSSNDTQILDSEVASAIALGLESLERENDDEDDFEESSGNAMSLLPDNSYNVGSQSPSSASGDTTCHTSNSLTDFSSTKCILQDSDSCGPSPEPTDAIDISCGISVLFEKCKNRRDLNVLSCSTSKIDKTSRSMVTTSESVSSQIERLSIAGNESHISTAHLSKEGSYKSEFTECASATSSLPNSSKQVDVAANLSPDRKYGVLFSAGNCPIVEETDDELHQPAMAENPAKNLQFKLPHEKAFKNPSLEHVVTTSAPCSPIPQSHRAQSTAGVAARKRKGNCVRRRVSFPENDMQLITSYLEPVNPWERMKRSVNSDEVLRAYMTSCRSHGCQPMPVVTNQIAALPLNVPGRVECFSLRGCKLELSQCEGLEEIFKRVQFVCIDLENCSLSDDTVIPLLDMIEFYDSTTHLNISGNSNIGMRGWQACSRMLKKNQSVRSLNARATNLNEVYMPILGKALKLGSRLHTLHLENCNLTGRPLINLTAALKLNDTVVKLYLADNRLGANDCIQIGNLMRTNLMLKLLDLRNNNLQDIGCAHVCEGIAEQSKSKLLIEADSVTDKQNVKKWGLNSLVLWNNHMTVSSAKHLAAMLLASTSIETLNVGRNSVSNDGAIRLKEALLRNKSLKRLYLHATKIGDEGAVALAELLAESKNIERVDLRENTIKVAGLMALAHSLRHNTSMVQMDLDSNPRLEPLEELAERHVSLLLEIKEYTQRNRTEMQAHLASTDSKEADSEDYYLDPDFRKLSLSSEIDGSQTLEIHTANPPPNRAVSIALGSSLGSEEHKKYRSPSPSPCASPVPSPSLSPVPPTPFKNRFKVFKVSSASSPGSCIVTANPIYSGNGSNALPSSAFPNLSSSAPSSSLPTPIISTTSRPIVHHPQPAGRNRFLSGGGRFTVTKVSDTNQASSIMKSKSLSLPQIPLMEPVKEAEPSSPKIVISSPAKIERGFSLEESPAEGKRSSISTVSQPRVSSEDACGASAAKNRTDSAESDDVFVDSFSQSEANSSLSLRADKKTTGAAVLSPVSKTRRDLTDSGFLEETSTDFEDAVTNLSIGSARDSDRDSLFSNTSDPDGHSPVSPFPPSDSAKTSSVSPNLPEASTFTPASNPPNSNSGEFLSSLPSRLGALFRGADRGTSLHLKLQSSSAVSENKSLDRSPSCAAEITSQPKRAPLASMENGSMDTDSEDSEVTTQSSDSTHSDEVRITSVEAAVEPVQAWGGDEAPVISNSNLEGLSTKNLGSEEFSRDIGHDKIQPEVTNEGCEGAAEQIPDGKNMVEPISTDP